MPMTSVNVTRGYGFLERFLAKKRAHQADKLIPHLSRSGKILDIGSGSYPFFLSTIGFAEKYGIDKTFSPSSQEWFHNHSLALIQHDIESEDPLPFDSEYFDVITMLAVFEHIVPHRLPGIFKDLYRILRKGGLIIITTPAPWVHSILKGMALCRLVSPQEISEHKRLYTPDSITVILKQGGFLSGNIQTGYFECYMNTWVKAQK